MSKFGVSPHFIPPGQDSQRGSCPQRVLALLNRSCGSQNPGGCRWEQGTGPEGGASIAQSSALGTIFFSHVRLFRIVTTENPRASHGTLTPLIPRKI